MKALTLEEKAIQIREAVKENELELARNYNDAGVAACYFHEYAKGMGFFQKAIKTLQTCAHDDPNAANILANISNAYLFLGDYDKAATLGKNAVEIATPIKFTGI